MCLQPPARARAQLGWAPGGEGGLLVAEPALTSRVERECLTQLAFEMFNVPGYFSVDQAVASLHAVGKSSGLVVDVGHDKIGEAGGRASGGVGRGSAG